MALQKKLIHSSKILVIGMQLLAASASRMYYEGYAAPGEIPDCTPLQHAWCIRGGEQLIDATWPTPKDSSYFGIQFATQATIQLQGGLSWKSDEDTMLDYLLNNPGEQISYIVRFAALES